MIRSSLKTLLVLSVCISFAATVFADPLIGQLLEKAMAARKTHNVSNVAEMFEAAVDKASSNEQKTNILFIYSDYLMEKEEWERAIQVQYQIIDYGKSSSQASAYYSLIRANLELNRIEEAKISAVELNASPAGESMRTHARTMKKIAPNSIDARISNLLEEAAFNSFLAESAHKQTKPPHSSKIVVTSSTPKPLPEEKTPVFKDSRQYSVQVGGWNSNLRGDLKSQGSSVSFGGDLSTERETSLTLAVETSTKTDNRYKATYTNFSFSGTLNKTFVHNAKTYNPGAEFHVRSKLLDLEAYRELRQRSKFAWGVLYGVMITDSRLEIAQNIPGMRQITSWESSFGYPYLGLAARSDQTGSIGWEASGKFFVWGGSDSYKTRDLELKILFGQRSRKLSSRSKIWAFIGYRDFCWDGDFDDAEIKLSFSGPILGIEFYF